MQEVIDSYFKGKQGKYIAITKYGTTWVNNSKKHSISFNKKSLELAVSYLPYQFFPIIGIFRQTIVVSIKSDLAPLLVNMFLFTYECKYCKLRKLTKQENSPIYFPFVDDFSAINENSEFKNNFKEIYPPKLALDKENLKALFLYLETNTKHKEFKNKNNSLRISI